MQNTIKEKIRSPVAFKHSFPESALKEMKDVPNGYLNSYLFNASFIHGVSYHLAVYPNGECEKQRGQTWFYLYLNYPDKLKIEADITISIESASYSKKSKVVYESSGGFGGKCCTTNELYDPTNLFIMDGKLTIKAEGTLTVEKDVPQKVELFGDNRDALCLGLWNQDNKDFVVLADEKEVHAHKCVLAAHSQVFTRMFEAGMKEAQENKVTIEDFTFEIVETAIKLCYHHSLVTYTSFEDKIKLLQFFDKYDMQKLKDNLENYLISVINELTVCKLVNGALIANARKLEMKCSEFLFICIKTKPICDVELLDKDFSLKLLKNSFCQGS